MANPLTDDAQVRAMVALLEAQAAQVVALRRHVELLEGRLSLRNALDSVVADEVNQALADLRMALSALRRLPQDPDRRWLADEASQRADMLANRIVELLRPAAVESVAVDREGLVEVSLPEVLERALSAVPALAAGRVVCEAPEELQLTTAPTRLAAVLAALVDNAARHGGDGPVRLDADVVFGDLVVRVTDDGPGLGGVDPETLFPAFAGGTGVGLYVARLLARSLGGDVTLSERPEGGVVATVTLPQRRDGDAAPRSMRELAVDW